MRSDIVIVVVMLFLTLRSAYNCHNIDFCHINNFNYSKKDYYYLDLVDGVSQEELYESMELGRPFAVSGVTKEWKATSKWNSKYFRSIFSNVELFSSTFATNTSPVFDAKSPDDRGIYYGIFLNDRDLADHLADDYSYPKFIPEELRMQGT